MIPVSASLGLMAFAGAFHVAYLAPDDRTRLLDIAGRLHLKVSEWRTERCLLATHENTDNRSEVALD